MLVRGLRPRRCDGRVAPVRRQIILERVNDEGEWDLAVGLRILLRRRPMAPTANETVLVTGALRPEKLKNTTRITTCSRTHHV